MKQILQIFILTIILFSCKTSYDKNYTIQCNQQEVRENKEKLEKEEKHYMDSIYLESIKINTIDILTTFIKSFPDSEYISQIKIKRQKLFQEKWQVENSRYDINTLLKNNPCYTPIYKNIDYLRNTNILFRDLINSELDSLNPYRYRFLVGNLNTIDENGESKGIKEKFFNINKSWEFRELFQFSTLNNISKDSLILLEKSVFNLLENKQQLNKQLRLYKNYINKVGNYLEDEIEKKYSSYRGYKYTGQELCFCEISGDTILLIAKHITSARGKTRHSISEDTITGTKEYEYIPALPIGKERKYYAAQNKISIKNWETQRKYNKEDKFRDSLMGGGNSRVTFFDGKSQLPNFLLIQPYSIYPRAMKMNGIHEGSLSNMSRCMLGTPQSLGCFRTTDYGSKFSRWWIPKYANLYICYDEDRYTYKDIPEKEITGIQIPFHSEKEGNKFRKWININHQSFAREIDLEETGSCNNCFIQLAWEKYFHEYIKTRDGKQLNFKPPVNLSEKKTEIIIKKEENETKIELSQFKIQQNYYIIIGCFKEINNANSYSKKIKKKGYPTLVFYNKNAKCNFVSIGPYLTKEKAKETLPIIQEKVDEDSWIFTKIK